MAAQVNSLLANTHYDQAKSAIRNSIARNRLRLPTDKPIIRIVFDQEPSWHLLALVQAFDYDAFYVFQQALDITDAYYGCFEQIFSHLTKIATRSNMSQTRSSKNLTLTI
jgi:hypothetical protein